MTDITIEKIVGSVPNQPSPNTAYLVRVGEGFDLWVTDSTGTAKRLNDAYSTNAMSASGRMYCYNDARWVTNADDNYGTNYYQWAESGGTGTNPTYEWEHKGDIVRAGTVIHELAMFMRVLDINTIADIEVCAVYVNPNGRWAGVGTGLDNDNEITVTELYRGLWKTGVGSNGSPDLAAITAPLNDETMRRLPINNFVVPADGEIRLYLKPHNQDPRPNTSTDYTQVVTNWLFSVPKIIF